jgi:hypothetical protein
MADLIRFASVAASYCKSDEVAASYCKSDEVTAEVAASYCKSNEVAASYCNSDEVAASYCNSDEVATSDSDANAVKALITFKKAQDNLDKILKEHENAELALDAAESARFVAVQDALDAYDASANPDLPPRLVVSLTRAMGSAYKAYEKAQAYCDETLVAAKNARNKFLAAKLNVTSTQAKFDNFNLIIPKLAIKSIATMAANKATDMTDKADNLAVHAEALAKKEEEAKASAKKATNAVFKNEITANDAEIIATNKALASKTAADEAKVISTAAKFTAIVAADMIAESEAQVVTDTETETVEPYVVEELTAAFTAFAALTISTK